MLNNCFQIQIQIENKKFYAFLKLGICVFLKPCVFIVVQVAEGGRRRLLDDVSLAAKGAGAAGPQRVHLSNLGTSLGFTQKLLTCLASTRRRERLRTRWSRGVVILVFCLRFA